MREFHFGLALWFSFFKVERQTVELVGAEESWPLEAKQNGCVAGIGAGRWLGVGEAVVRPHRGLAIQVGKHELLRLVGHSREDRV